MALFQQLCKISYSFLTLTQNISYRTNWISKLLNVFLFKGGQNEKRETFKLEEKHLGRKESFNNSPTILFFIVNSHLSLNQ